MTARFVSPCFRAISPMYWYASAFDIGPGVLSIVTMLKMIEADPKGVERILAKIAA